jgi:hypothetical protein
MPHMTRIERRGLERGRAEGKAEMLLRVLRRRYRTVLPEELVGKIRGTVSEGLLEEWLDWTYDAASLEDFQERLKAE